MFKSLTVAVSLLLYLILQHSACSGAALISDECSCSQTINNTNISISCINGFGTNRILSGSPNNPYWWLCPLQKFCSPIHPNCTSCCMPAVSNYALTYMQFFNSCAWQTHCTYTNRSVPNVCGSGTTRRVDEILYWCISASTVSTTSITTGTTSRTSSYHTTSSKNYSTKVSSLPNHAKDNTSAIIAGVVCSVGGALIIAALIVTWLILRKRKHNRDRFASETVNQQHTVTDNDNAPFSSNCTGNSFISQNGVTPSMNESNSVNEVAINASPSAPTYAVINRTNEQSHNESSSNQVTMSVSPSAPMYAAINRENELPHNYTGLLPKLTSAPISDHTYNNVPSTPATVATEQSPASEGDYGGVTLVDNSLYESTKPEGDYGDVTLVDNVIYD